MKLLLFITILGLSICLGCGNTTDKKETVKADIEYISKKELTFDEYVKVIPQTKLPLDLTCEIELQGSTYNFDRAIIDKYGIENSRINGKIAVTDNYISIIYLYPADIVLPIIQTADKEGKKISELKLFEKYCGEDEFYWGTSWANISDDFTITLSDSAITYQRNDKDEIIEESKKTEVRHRNFKINNNGVIVEIKNEP